MNEASGRAAVRAMRAPASTWAHDTGFSERAFFVESGDVDRDVVIGNRARYARVSTRGIPEPTDTARCARTRYVRARRGSSRLERRPPRSRDRVTRPVSMREHT